jgi:hypothetical protein
MRNFAAYVTFRPLFFCDILGMYTLHDSQGVSPFRFNLIASRVTDGAVVCTDPLTVILD